MKAPRIVAAAVAAALVAAAPASARLIAAESVMPAGNSGFLPQSGAVNPYLTDQIALFESFTYKQATFNQPGQTATPRAGVSITRDAHAVPNVRAGSQRDLWWGVGYAAAQDRAVQLEFFRRGTKGTLAEILPGEIASDVAARRDYYTDGELRRMLRRLPAELRDRFDAYADGVNAVLAELRADPAKRPAEFQALGFVPADFEALDLARIGVQLARTIPSGDGAELANARLLRRIGAEAFDRVLPVRRSDQAATIPESEGRFPSQPGRTRADERAGFRASQRFVRRLRLPRATVAAARLIAGGSNHWAFRAGGRALLFSGPQLGFQIPEQLWELEVHAPGLDARGVTPVGLPVIGIGHNGRVAWGATSGLTDDDDLYVERLAGRERYRFKGRVRRMSCRTERFRIAGGAARTERFCRTVHGPVQARASGVAYARRYAIWKREIDTLTGLAALNVAADIKGAEAAIRRMTWTENLMVADHRGNIGWFHPGTEPLRPRRWDERLPLPGTGEAEWRGLLSWKDHPKVVNPGRQWLANWNNVPSKGWTTGDLPASEQGVGRLHRVVYLNRLVAQAQRLGTFAALKGVDRLAGTTFQQRGALTGQLRAARSGADPQAAAVLDAILAWNGDYDRTDAEGRVDPGVAAYEELGVALARRVVPRAVRDRFGEPDVPGAAVHRSHPYDLGATRARAFFDASAADLRAAAQAAAAALQRRFGTADPAAWRRPRLLYDYTLQGIAPKPRMEAMDRGTWQQAVELGP